MGCGVPASFALLDCCNSLIWALPAGMIAVGWWIAARLTHSLERLAVYARNVRDGRVAAPPESRAREIAELSRAFEEMRDTLEGRQHVERHIEMVNLTPDLGFMELLR